MVRTLYFLFVLAIFQIVFSCSSGKKDNLPEDDQNFQNPLNPQLNALNDAIQSNPDKPDYFFKRAKVYFEEKNYRYALKDINEAIHLDNSNNNYYSFLAHIYRALNKNSLALKVAKQAEALNSQDPELYILMAQIYLDINDKKNADFYLNQSAILAPLHSEIYVLKGNILAKNGDTAAALIQYMTALNKDKQNINALEELAKLYDAKKKYDSSMVFIVSGKSINNKEPYFDFLSGKVYEHLNLNEAARASYEAALANDSTFFLAGLHLGNIYYKRNNLPLAFKWYTYGLKFDNDVMIANQRVGEILELSDKAAEAIPYYERASLIDTNNHKLKASLKKLYALYPDRKITLPPPSLITTGLISANDSAVIVAPKTSLISVTNKNKKAPNKGNNNESVAPVTTPEIIKPSETPIVQPQEKAIPSVETSNDNDKDNDSKSDFKLKSLFKKKKKNKDTIQ